jgi:hypothetical protein
MATDISAIEANIEGFYDFAGKLVIHVGAGGGQLIGYASKARAVTAVDTDPAAVARLQEAIREKSLGDRFEVVLGDLSAVSSPADVVYFEFCLHEMEDPDQELRRGLELAPEGVVVDHLPESRWAWYAAEERKAEASWAALRRLKPVREASFEATQRFADFRELSSRISVLGEPAISRVRRLEEQRRISIQMLYGMALVRRQAAPP